MADNVLFDVDAAQILAKLHLAGLQPLKYIDKVNDFIVNTGIKNDDPSAKPDNPGKVTFDLNNSTNVYQVGYATTLVYTKSYSLDDTINKLVQMMSSIAGKNIDDKIAAEEQKEIDALKSKLGPELKAKNKGKDVPLETVDDVKKAKELAKTIVQDEANDFEASKKELEEKSVQILKEYLNGFAGVDNVEESKVDDAKMIVISDKIKKSSDKSLVSTFQIQEAPKAEVEKMVEQFKLAYQKDPNKPNCKQRVCFVVSYTLNIDK